MEKTFSEPEEKLTENDFSPFAEAVNEKSYTKPNVTIKPEDIAGDIPEPPFNPPPLNPEVGADAAIPKKKPTPPPPPVNPKMENLPPKDQKKSAEYMADMMIGGYEMMWGYCNRFLLFPKKKMVKLAQSGEVDFSVQIPYDVEGNTISAAELIDEYNSQQDGALNVTQEFKDEVRPPLVEVLQKRGMGVTSEQKLAFIVLKDTIPKCFMIGSGLATIREMTNTMKEMTQAMNNGGYTNNTAPRPKKPTPPPPPEPMEFDVEETQQEVEVDAYEPVYNANTDNNMDLDERVEAQISPEYREKMKRAVIKPKKVAPSGRKGRPKKS